MLLPPDDFKILFPTTGNEELASRYKVSRPTIQRWAKSLNIEKTLEYKSSIQRKRSIGQIHTEETKDKIRQKAIGREMSQDTIRKIWETKRKNNSHPKGENHPNWKGGRPWERFKDERYIAWRNSVLERDKYICQDCKRQCAKYEKGLAAHHIKEYAKYPELRLELSNGLTLCRECHMALHGKNITIKQIPCKCGCGTMINDRDRYGRPRSFVNHHGKKKVNL